MNPYDASNVDAVSVRCAVCDKEIPDGHWFTRIKKGRWTLALCSPFCTELFEQDPAPHLRRIEKADQP